MYSFCISFYSACFPVNFVRIQCTYLEKAMATHSSTLAWKLPWTEEPGRLQSMGSQSQTGLSDFTSTFHFHALEKEMATHSSVLAWRIPRMEEAAIYRVTQSQTRLKRLSSSVHIQTTWLPWGLRW